MLDPSPTGSGAATATTEDMTVECQLQPMEAGRARLSEAFRRSSLRGNRLFHMAALLIVLEFARADNRMHIISHHNATVGRSPQDHHIHSPDPFCAIHLGAVRDLWFFQALPVISNWSQLMTSEWRDYLHAVYGPLDSEESFPIDLRCFTHWWHNLLPMSQRSLFQRHYRPGGLAAATRGSLVDYSGVSAKKGAVAWQLYLLDDADVTSTMNRAMGRYEHQLTAVPFHTNGGVEFQPIALNPSYKLTSLWQHDERFTIRGPVPSHAWIEVYHEFNDCAHASRPKHVRGGLSPNVGWWAHFAPGSGVWANVGTTLIVGAQGYRVACTATATFTNRSTTACDRCCTPAHKILTESALDLQYTSLQSCCGQRGGTGQATQYEIVFFTPTCVQQRINSSACPPELNLRSGRTRAAHGTTNVADVKSGHSAGMCRYMGMWRR